MMEENQIFKIILIGDNNVGKTQILQRYYKNEFNNDSVTTVGVEFITKKIEIQKNHFVKAQIWDTAGSEKYKSVTVAYYKGAAGCIIVYDISNRKSFESVDSWISQIKQNADLNLLIMLVGNKSDLKNREVSQEEAQQFSQQNNIAFMETSALNGSNIENTFNLLIKEICEILKKRSIVSKIDSQKINQKKKKSLC